MRTLLVIRPKDKWETSRRIVEEQGMKAICASVVEVEYLAPSDLSGSLDGLRDGEFGSLVFASVTAVKALVRAVPDALRTLPEGIQVVAIGPPTAQALRAEGVKEVLVPRAYTSEGLVEMLSEGSGGALMLRSDHGNEVLRIGLKGRRGLKEVVMYSLHQDHQDPLDQALDALHAGDIDAVLHTSSLSAQLIVERAEERFGSGWRWNAVNAAIGPPTRDALVSLGVPVQVMAPKATFTELVKAVHAHLLRERI